MLYKTDVLQTTPYCYGKGFTYFLSYVLFQDEEPFNILEVSLQCTRITKNIIPLQLYHCWCLCHQEVDLLLKLHKKVYFTMS